MTKQLMAPPSHFAMLQHIWNRGFYLKQNYSHQNEWDSVITGKRGMQVALAKDTNSSNRTASFSTYCAAKLVSIRNHLHDTGKVLTTSSLEEELEMENQEIEGEIRSLFANLKNDQVESLLVQCADWGINVRMFLNGNILELDLMKNYEGYEVTFVDDTSKEPIQIDDLPELLQVTGISWE